MINFIDIAPNLIAIFIMCLIVSGNFLAELFPCQVQRIFSNSMIVKHAFGFMTLLFFVVLTIPEMQEQEYMFGYTALVYAWFIMMAKCYYTLWFVVFGLVGLLYLLQIYEKGLKDEEKEGKKEMINKGKEGLTITALALTIFGFLVYMGAKKLEYKKEFRYMTFIFGKPNCRGDDASSEKEGKGLLGLLKHVFD